MFIARLCAFFLFFCNTQTLPACGFRKTAAKVRKKNRMGKE